MKPPALTTQTAVTASFSSAISPIIPNGAGSHLVCEGWLLKKRRKKMQGYGKRYFVLYHTGLLQYSFEPGHPVRDQVSLLHSAISTSPGRKDIHIDSNTSTFHVKCLSTDDFETWMLAFRKFISSGVEAGRKRSASIRIVRQGNAHFNRTNDIVEEMAQTIKGLDDAFLLLAQSLQAPPSLRDGSTSGRKGEKEKHREKFGLFRKHSDMGLETSAPSNSTLRQGVQVAIDLLKSQHSALAKMLQSTPSSDPTSATSRISLPNTVEEEGTISSSPHSSLMGFKHPHPHRASYATSVSESMHEWFDAENGPEEFFVDDPREHLDQQPSLIATLDSGSMLENSDRGSIDTDLGEDGPIELLAVGNSQQVYRSQLPAPCAEDEGSLFAILKNNVGKDLSTITFPVTFNEPLSLLQRTAEEMEYWDLLNQAADSYDPVTRICYVAAFAVSGYAHTRHRTGRKGFNPMLAETFEDPRMKFIAEKVQHNPVEMAYHAEGTNWELTALSAGRTKFWGKSLEVIPIGKTRVRIGTDLYVWTKPSSFMRNLMVGTKYFDHCGRLIIENITTGMRCNMDFKQNGYWGAMNVVSGIVQGCDGGTLTKLEGKWDDQMSQILDNEHLHVLWRCSPFPKNSLDYYGFTSFTFTLNEITSEMVQRLPPTDSRLRSDVRALEEGNLTKAEAEKARIEEAQRERRRRGQDRQPRWFKKVGDEWEYAGGYWELRSRSWKSEPVQPLW